MPRPDAPAGHVVEPGDHDRLLRAAARGDDLAWAELVRRHAELVRTVCRRCGVFGACADDVAQVTWLALFTHIERIHTPFTGSRRGCGRRPAGSACPCGVARPARCPATIWTPRSWARTPTTGSRPTGYNR
ncbi:MAG: sigma-70 family RNA polymerase sigma factor [Kineosporiaceae bacterium]|nr:sigma-70 family RNA polymerase sigma factor [Kineosporiaceae bacterium]